MAAVADLGVSAMMACSSSSRSLQGGAMCSSFSQVSTMAPLRLRNNAYTSSSRVVLPTSRGLKFCSGALAKRLPATAGRASQRKGVVCEASETAAGTTRLKHGAAGAVSDKTFQKLVLESDVPVLVDFWAPWCGPCRMIAPMIDELARQYAGRLRCLKLNTDESPYIATEYGIRSIPTVMIFMNGEKKDTVIGAVPESTLTTTVEKYLSQK